MQLNFLILAVWAALGRQGKSWARAGFSGGDQREWLQDCHGDRHHRHLCHVSRCISGDAPARRGACHQHQCHTTLWSHLVAGTLWSTPCLRIWILSSDALLCQCNSRVLAPSGCQADRLRTGMPDHTADSAWKFPASPPAQGLSLSQDPSLALANVIPSVMCAGRCLPALPVCLGISPTL